MTIFDDIAKAEEEEKKIIDLGILSPMVSKQAMLEAPKNDITVDTLYKKAQALFASVADLEAIVKLRKKELFNVRQIQIPEHMAELGLESVTTEDGTTINIKGDITVTLKDPQAFYSLLRKEGKGDIIKDTITVTLQKDSEAPKIVKALEKANCLFDRKETVHFQTLKKYFKELRKKGKNVSEEIAGVYEYKYSKLKKKK